MTEPKLIVGQEYDLLEMVGKYEFLKYVTFETDSLKSRFGKTGGLIKIVDDQYVVVPSTARMMGLVPGKVLVLAHYNPKSRKRAKVYLGD